MSGHRKHIIISYYYHWPQTKRAKLYCSKIKLNSVGLGISKIDILKKSLKLIELRG